MFKSLSFIIIIIITGCNGEPSASVSPKDTVIRHDTVYTPPQQDDWQAGFGLTHDPNIDSIWGKPVRFYLEDKNCSHLAYDFYYGYRRPSDDGATYELLKLACTDNDKLRPLYRWCLNKTIQVSDGALGEMTGIPARQYAEKFPEDFFEYMDKDTSKTRYNDWVAAISYSGFYEEDDYKQPQTIRQAIIKRMRKNCTGSNESMYKRIEQFAKDCF